MELSNTVHNAVSFWYWNVPKSYTFSIDTYWRENYGSRNCWRAAWVVSRLAMPHQQFLYAHPKSAVGIHAGMITDYRHKSTRHSFLQVPIHSGRYWLSSYDYFLDYLNILWLLRNSQYRSKWIGIILHIWLHWFSLQFCKCTPHTCLYSIFA